MSVTSSACNAASDQARLRTRCGEAELGGVILVPDDEGQFIAGVLATSPSDGEPPSFTQRHR